jgi:hypothetical protein
MMRELERDEVVDMSPEAVMQRLREAGQLYRLGLALMSGRVVERVKQPAREEVEEKTAEGGERDGER